MWMIVLLQAMISRAFGSKVVPLQPLSNKKLRETQVILGIEVVQQLQSNSDVVIS